MSPPTYTIILALIFSRIYKCPIISSSLQEFPTQLKRTAVSVGVLRSHDQTSFLFQTQELKSRRKRATEAIPAGVCLSSLNVWPVGFTVAQRGETVTAGFTSLTRQYNGIPSEDWRLHTARTRTCAPLTVWLTLHKAWPCFTRCATRGPLNSNNNHYN